ncbi:MAG: hypothetical protein A2W91_02090 [Bacteroidetes bacterium GWF2_38_335]|nr:MAG: hypothetical protein A2W91_02090 [Bacteroidetes bacterium GWF2_38_335]OFY80643.1 MAG: hypothetical protein A2281_05105 [Bacteroidetes bacterium RIFOXYA12_FULL_38_20]HBS86984.1 CoA protein activase [Bacteroidales bacterium]
MKTENFYRAGIDIGSTTAKIVVLDTNGNIIFKNYQRHNTYIFETVIEFALQLQKEFGDARFDLNFTGSAGMGVAEKTDQPFIQEVIAAAEIIKLFHTDVNTLIDIGGEDSKMIFFHPDRPPDIRMNGNCAGGTGSFIDQISSLLNIPLSEINSMAEKHTAIYPMASRCGVFAKTDIQNLVNRKIPFSDILASAFHAVSIQTLNTLSRGFDIEPKLMFSGGPFTFFPYLKTIFCKNLGIGIEQTVQGINPELLAAYGAAILAGNSLQKISSTELIQKLKKGTSISSSSERLNPLFFEVEEYDNWNASKNCKKIAKVLLKNYEGEKLFLGIDSGSTTTKVVVTGENDELLYAFYSHHHGNPVETLEKAFIEFKNEMESCGRKLNICFSVVTGYGEDLVRAAFNVDFGLVETIAHYVAAKNVHEDVSFILDIGGQDMKAIFIEGQGISRIELNESCSSGCGTFLETFAGNLGLNITNFATMACFAQTPYDLGTRCTVFMNSKVKQALRENASLEDIAAGLSYSVIKNALYKVLKIHNMDDLGNTIVVQGGTFKNASVYRALELVTGKKVFCSDIPEYMGAYGAAITAKTEYLTGAVTDFSLENALSGMDRFSSKGVQCKGCENVCTVTRFEFVKGNFFYSGNKCEKVFTNKGNQAIKAQNLVEEKYRLLFDRKYDSDEKPLMTIGIPRALNFYENYPFWHSLFVSCGIDVVLSSPSTASLFEKGRGTVMSDSICFPARLVNGHIFDLAEKKPDRIFYPIIVYENSSFSNTVNSYNCPIVTGYPDVINSAVNVTGKYGIPFDKPTFCFKDEDLLRKSCLKYLKSIGIKRKTALRAFEKATDEQNRFKQVLLDRAIEIINDSTLNNRLLVVLAGRPYHTDPLINQKIPEMLSNMGIDVITDDSLPLNDMEKFRELRVISQWAYPNRIYNAAHFVASKKDNIQLVQINSFGCGPDAIVIDEVNDILRESGKCNTVIRVDEISSTGSIKIRLRSMAEAVKLKNGHPTISKKRTTTVDFGMGDKHRTIIAPLFSDIYSLFLPPLFEASGYRLKNLPRPDKESVDFGLRYSNNEICYPATIIVGDIIKFLEKGEYNPDEIAIGITQTGGQCRASSYLSLIKKAMVSAGYAHIPVISVSSGSGIINTQPGFKIDWGKLLKISFVSALYADSLAKMYYSTVVREKESGISRMLMDKYIAEAYKPVKEKNVNQLFSLLRKAVEDFNQVPVNEGIYPKIGIVGEIFVKYNSYGNLNVPEWLINQGIEVCVPPLMDFFTQYFINVDADIKTGMKKYSLSDLYLRFIELRADLFVQKAEKINRDFRYFTPFHSIRRISRYAERILSIANQYGEGWLIPAEISAFAEDGVNNVVSLQPFGCIANQIISKGVEKRLRDFYPELNLLFLDFDDGASEVNVHNRLYFMVRNVKENIRNSQPVIST